MAKCEWRTHLNYELVGTYIWLVPNAAGGWFIVDAREADVSLGKGLTIESTKSVAERLAARDEWLRKTSE